VLGQSPNSVVVLAHEIFRPNAAAAASLQLERKVEIIAHMSRPTIVINFIHICCTFDINIMKQLTVPGMTFKGHPRSFAMSSFVRSENVKVGYTHFQTKSLK